MKKISLIGLTSLAASAGHASTGIDENQLLNSTNLKPGQQVVFVTQRHEQIAIQYDDLIQQLKGKNATNSKNIQIENHSINLNFLDDLSIDVSIDKQTDSPPNVDPITE